MNTNIASHCGNTQYCKPTKQYNKTAFKTVHFVINFNKLDICEW